jgi:hypothetical protein
MYLQMRIGWERGVGWPTGQYQPKKKALILVKDFTDSANKIINLEGL